MRLRLLRIHLYGSLRYGIVWGTIKVNIWLRPRINLYGPLRGGVVWGTIKISRGLRLRTNSYGSSSGERKTPQRF